MVKIIVFLEKGIFYPASTYIQPDIYIYIYMAIGQVGPATTTGLVLASATKFFIYILVQCSIGIILWTAMIFPLSEAYGQADASC